MKPTQAGEEKKQRDDERTPSYYMLDVAALPDKEYVPSTPSSVFYQYCRTAGPAGFAANSLRSVLPLPLWLEIECVVRVAGYIAMNAFPPLIVIWAFLTLRWTLLAILLGISFFPVPSTFSPTSQFLYTERHNQKYCSLKMLWPASLRPACSYSSSSSSSASTASAISGSKRKGEGKEGEQASSSSPSAASSPQRNYIFICIPHAVIPFGICCYAMYYKVFGGKPVRFVGASILFRIPIIRQMVQALGVIPADKKSIIKALREGYHVGLMLDGIAGMFNIRPGKEVAQIMNRFGICKISLMTGVPLVPVFFFGQTSQFSAWYDPWGVMKKMSRAAQASLVLFWGRFYLWAPYREPILVAFGDPLDVPLPSITSNTTGDKSVKQAGSSGPTDAEVQALHARMVEGLRKVFETHKAAYGWQHKVLEFI
eukprot:gb/GEZN01003974.1/.p1 GENE.gb/GEZN01003974.1/~~gb/GEZN01003974.1/.p1  ORF type:complete len:426 (-),score=78.17 gb/GEZN01003974.1/:343-1620(-)